MIATEYPTWMTHGNQRGKNMQQQFPVKWDCACRSHLSIQAFSGSCSPGVLNEDINEHLVGRPEPFDFDKILS